MENLKEQLKTFLSKSLTNYDLTYQHVYNNGNELVEFGIASKTNDEYFFIDSFDGATSVRAYYKLNGMENEASIVVDLSQVRDDHCVVRIKSLDEFEFKVDVSTNGKVSLCLL